MKNLKIKNKELEEYIEVIDRMINNKTQLTKFGSLAMNQKTFIYYMGITFYQIKPNFDTTLHEVNFPMDKVRYIKIDKIIKNIVSSDNDEVIMMYAKIVLNIIKDYYVKYLGEQYSKTKNIKHSNRYKYNY